MTNHPKYWKIYYLRSNKSSKRGWRGWEGAWNITTNDNGADNGPLAEELTESSSFLCVIRFNVYCVSLFIIPLSLSRAPALLIIKKYITSGSKNNTKFALKNSTDYFKWFGDNIHVYVNINFNFFLIQN